MQTVNADVVVLGAGPAGLAAAWQAARRGLAVTVLERGSHVGGMSASFDVAGQRVDFGSHRLHPATPPALLSDLRDLLGDDLQLRPRNGRVRLAGHWVGFPLRAGQLLSTLPMRFQARVARDALTRPLRGGHQHSYADVLEHGLGRTAYQALYAPYAEKLWGLPGERISPMQAHRRVSADTPGKIVAKLIRGRRRTGQGQQFWYPRRGFGQIVESLAAAGHVSGVHFATGAEVERLAIRRDGVTAYTRSGDSVRARRAFSTLPLPILARVASPGAPLAAVEAAGRLRFRAMVLVYVVHEGGRWTSFDAHYLPGPETPITRLSEPANYRISRTDPETRSVLCAEIPCRVGDEVWVADDATLGDLVEQALAATGLPPLRRGSVAVHRLRHVYPIYERGYEDNLAGLEEWADSLPSVTTFGRMGLFAHDNTHHAIAMGYDAAAALRPGGGWDSHAWEAARQRFASHVVED